MSEIKMKIEKYFGGSSQYPFLLVLSLDEYKNTLDLFSSTSKIKVSDYCVGEDKEPDLTRLINDLKATVGNHLLVGLGDYLASKDYSESQNLLSPFKDMELKNECHVAVLLTGHMYPLVSEFAKDVRVRNRVFLPKSAPYTPLINNSSFVYGIKAYLESCEKGEGAGNVKSARKISGATVINPESAFQELKHLYPNDFNRLSESSGSNDDWVTLLTALNKEKKNVMQYLTSQGIDINDSMFLVRAKKNDYKSWLYFILLKLQTGKQGYLCFAVSKAVILENLFDAVKSAILDIAVTDNRFADFYEQRKILLKGSTDADMADFVPKIHIRGIDRIAYLTDNTKIEKQSIIESICEGAKMDYLPISYPDLHNYMQDYLFNDKIFTNYFSSYKRCKLTNQLDGTFLSIVTEYAVSRPYNSLPTLYSVFSGFEKDNTVLIWLDAMGAEFLGFIKEVSAELKLHFVPKIARATLPTITSLNRGFYDEWQGAKETPIKDIDDLKHNPERGYDFNNSPLPIHLSEELEAVRTALERAKTKLATGSCCKKVIIASDHGASRLAVINKANLIPNNGCVSKSSGRYCQGHDLPTADNITHEGEYAVISDYSRFEGSRTPSVEVHGGATLEEVVVPVIELT